MTPRLCAAACLALLVLAVRSAAQEPAAPPAPPLSDEQAAIKVRFDRFEETLLKMARYLQKTEPARAELVMRALRRSREERLADRMTLVSGMLSKGENKSPSYADAITEQDAILADLREILQILRSEDILDENRKEQERLKELARQITALIDAEKVHQADTGRGEPTDRIAQGQQRTADKTESVIKKVDEHDRAAGKKAEGDRRAENGEKGESKPGEESPPEAGEPKQAEPQDGQQPGQPKPGEQSDPTEGDPSKGEGQPKPSEQGEQRQSQESQSQEGQKGQKGRQQQGQQGESQQGEQQEGRRPQNSPQATPGRDELEAARERMERAIKELKTQNRGEASKAQEEAIRKLIEAKERIEELLRQLREEEREMMLRALEARFQKMLQLQQFVLDATKELQPIANDKWQDREFARCREAAAGEREILVEADKALEVLRADGSSVAFPEAVEQIRTDVAEVAGRLGREDAGGLTVVIEQEIIDALQEMILAFQKEMEKLREKKEQGQQGQPGQQGDPSLVDKLAELKMLKTLQIRVNRRTKTLGELFEGEQAAEPEIVAQLRELAERQGRLQRATHDLATGKAE